MRLFSLRERSLTNQLINTKMKTNYCKHFKKVIKYHLLSVALFLFISQHSLAQNDSSTIVSKTKKTSKATVISLGAGTVGFAFDIKYCFSKNFIIKAGGNYFKLNQNDLFSVSNTIPTTTNVQFDLTNAHLKTEIGGKWLRLVVGAGYFSNLNVNISSLPKGDYTIGNTVLKQADLGFIETKLAYSGIAPYAGISLFRYAPKKAINFTLDLGNYFLPTPEAAIIGTGLLESNNSLTPLYQNNVNDWRYYPVLQFNLNIKL